MSIPVPQNFYKETVATAWATGGGNFYVSTKPTVSVGYLVISPENSSLREIVKFTAVGTDGGGDYVTVLAADRGLGGTTEQTHAVGEKVYMNVTAQTIQDLSDAIDQIVAAGAQDASTSTKGIVKLSTAPASATEPIAVGVNDTTILPTSDQKDALAGADATPSASNKFLTEDDINSTFFPTPQVVVFTSSGTWTKDAGLKYIIVEGVGGGGGCDDDDNGAGSGGGYFRKLILASALGSTETVTIGAAGTSAALVGSATNGGNTSFGSHCTGNGGTKQGGAGGTATGGDINITGEVGQGGSSGTGGNYSYGGASMLGKGGATPSGYGSGASSANGAKAGIVIVTEYYS